jgi:branched-chain amino acid transport system permease protein
MMQDNQEQQSLWGYAIRVGWVAGIALLYVGAVGMLTVFNERELVRDLVGLGQVLLVAPGFIAGLMIAKQAKAMLANKKTIAWSSVPASILAGLLTAIPSLLVLLLGQVIDYRSVFVSLNKDWKEVITLNQDFLITGGIYLVLALTIAAALAALVSLLPERLRQALSFGTMLSLLIALFGETVTLILKENLSRDTMDVLFRRNTIKQLPFFILWASAIGIGLIRAYFGERIRQNYAGLSPSTQKAGVRVWQSLLVAFLIALPWLIGRTLSDILVTVGIFVLMGLGLNIAIGLAGLLDLGFVTNYAVGAYVLALLTTTSAMNVGGGVFNFWMVIPVAILLAMFTGFVFALPVLKMRGDYLAIATLGFGEIIGKLAISDWLKPYIGGAQGILFIPKPNFFGIELKNPEQLYYVVLGACLLTIFVSIRLNNSRIGRQWMAIREDEDVASAMGIDTARSKLLAFTLSAATGGLAGAIFAAKVGTVFPKSFIVLISINVLSLIIVGGMGSNLGIIMGALALIGLPELLREFSEFRWLLYGALLIFMMLRKPDGFIPSKIKQRETQLEQSQVG